MARPEADARTPGVQRGPAFTVAVDGRAVPAHAGESVLGVLWAAGVRTLRASPVQGEPRGFFCAMGACFECLVTVDDRPNVRACVEPVRAGMRIATGAAHGR